MLAFLAALGAWLYYLLIPGLKIIFGWGVIWGILAILFFPIGGPLASGVGCSALMSDDNLIDVNAESTVELHLYNFAKAIDYDSYIRSISSDRSLAIAEIKTDAVNELVQNRNYHLKQSVIFGEALNEKGLAAIDPSDRAIILDLTVDLLRYMKKVLSNDDIHLLEYSDDSYLKWLTAINNEKENIYLLSKERGKVKAFYLMINLYTLTGAGIPMSLIDMGEVVETPAGMNSLEERTDAMMPFLIEAHSKAPFNRKALKSIDVEFLAENTPSVLEVSPLYDHLLKINSYIGNDVFIDKSKLQKIWGARSSFLNEMMWIGQWLMSSQGHLEKFLSKQNAILFDFLMIE